MRSWDTYVCIGFQFYVMIMPLLYTIESDGKEVIPKNRNSHGPKRILALFAWINSSGVATDFRVGGGAETQEPNLGYPQILFSHRISATNFFNTALTP